MASVTGKAIVQIDFPKGDSSSTTVHQPVLPPVSPQTPPKAEINQECTLEKSAKPEEVKDTHKEEILCALKEEEAIEDEVQKHTETATKLLQSQDPRAKELLAQIVNTTKAYEQTVKEKGLLSIESTQEFKKLTSLIDEATKFCAIVKGQDSILTTDIKALETKLAQLRELKSAIEPKIDKADKEDLAVFEKIDTEIKLIETALKEIQAKYETLKKDVASTDTEISSVEKLEDPAKIMDFVKAEVETKLGITIDPQKLSVIATKKADVNIDECIKEYVNKLNKSELLDTLKKVTDPQIQNQIMDNLSTHITTQSTPANKADEYIAVMTNISTNVPDLKDSFMSKFSIAFHTEALTSLASQQAKIPNYVQNLPSDVMKILQHSGKITDTGIKDELGKAFAIDTTVGTRLEVGSKKEFDSLSDALDAAKTVAGAKAVVCINDGTKTHYELRSITVDGSLDLHSTNLSRLNPKFKLEMNVNFVGISISKDKASPGGDLFISKEKSSETSDEILQAMALESVKNVKGTPDDKRDAMLKSVLPKLEGYEKLLPDDKNNLEIVLKKFSLDDLIKDEIQGLGGEDGKTDMVVGSGVEGHYTNSILNSVSQLLKSDRLTSNVIKSLEDMTAKQLVSDLDKQKSGLIRSMLQDIAFPDKINQHNRASCVATVGQIYLAVKDPDKYIQIVTSLATSKGNVDKSLVDFQNTKQMSRADGVLTDDKSGRSITGRLIQASFLDYANMRLNYSNSYDAHFKESPPFKISTDTMKLKLEPFLTNRCNLGPTELTQVLTALKTGPDKILDLEVSSPGEIRAKAEQAIKGITLTSTQKNDILDGIEKHTTFNISDDIMKLRLEPFLTNRCNLAQDKRQQVLTALKTGPDKILDLEVSSPGEIRAKAEQAIKGITLTSTQKNDILDGIEKHTTFNISDDIMKFRLEPFLTNRCNLGPTELTQVLTALKTGPDKILDLKVLSPGEIRAKAEQALNGITLTSTQKKDILDGIEKYAAFDHTGLYSTEAKHLLDGIMGLSSVKGLFRSEGDDEEVIEGLKQDLQKGPAMVLLNWSQGAHEVLLTKIDSNHAYFMNPWGTLQKMNIADFQERLKSFVVPQTTIPSYSMAKLPGAASNENNYKDISVCHYKTASNFLEDTTIPVIRDKLKEKIKNYSMDDYSDSIEQLIPVLKTTTLNAKLDIKLDSVTDKYETNAIIASVTNLGKAIKSGILDNLSANAILDALQHDNADNFMRLSDKVLKLVDAGILDKTAAKDALDITSDKAKAAENIFDAWENGKNLVDAGLLTKTELESNLKGVIGKKDEAEELSIVMNHKYYGLQEAQPFLSDGILKPAELGAFLKGIDKKEDAISFYNVCSTANKLNLPQDKITEIFKLAMGDVSVKDMAKFNAIGSLLVNLSNMVPSVLDKHEASAILKPEDNKTEIDSLKLSLQNLEWALGSNILEKKDVIFILQNPTDDKTKAFNLLSSKGTLKYINTLLTKHGVDGPILSSAVKGADDEVKAQALADLIQNLPWALASNILTKADAEEMIQHPDHNKAKGFSKISLSGSLATINEMMKNPYAIDASSFAIAVKGINTEDKAIEFDVPLQNLKWSLDNNILDKTDVETILKDPNKTNAFAKFSSLDGLIKIDELMGKPYNIDTSALSIAVKGVNTEDKAIEFDVPLQNLKWSLDNNILDKTDVETILKDPNKTNAFAKFSSLDGLTKIDELMGKPYKIDTSALSIAVKRVDTEDKAIEFDVPLQNLKWSLDNNILDKTDVETILKDPNKTNAFAKFSSLDGLTKIYDLMDTHKIDTSALSIAVKRVDTELKSTQLNTLLQTLLNGLSDNTLKKEEVEKRLKQ